MSPPMIDTRPNTSLSGKGTIADPINSPQLSSSSVLVSAMSPKEATENLVLASKLTNAEKEIQKLKLKLGTATSPRRAAPARSARPVSSKSVVGVTKEEHERCAEELRLAKIKMGQLTKERSDLRGSVAVLEGKVEGVVVESAMKISDLQAKLSNALGELDMKSAMLESSKSVGNDVDGMVKKLTERYEEERERMKHSIDSLQKAHAMSVKQARASGESRDVLMSKMFSMEREKTELFDRAVKAESTIKEVRRSEGSELPNAALDDELTPLTRRFAHRS